MKKIKILTSIVLTTILATSAVLAWTDLWTVSDSDTLTSALWNTVVWKINENGNRLEGIYNVWGDIGVGETNPQAKLDVNWSIRATWFYTTWLWYTKTPLACIDACIGMWWRMATSDEMYAVAASKTDICSIMRVLDSNNVNMVLSWYPMYWNKTTSTWCWPTWTWDVPRLVILTSNASWNSTGLYDCWCYWIK